MEVNMSTAIELLELNIKQKEVENKNFYYIDLGGSYLTKRIWINPKYFEKELKLSKETIGILKNAQLETTSKLNHVIKIGENNLFFVLARCGYRGSSEIKVISNYINIVNFFYYHSPRGNLGISDGAIIETKEDKVKIKWYRSGRLYGEPDKGLSIINSNGKIDELIDLEPEEIDEILTE
jgi:hypothetical protein